MLSKLHLHFVLLFIHSKVPFRCNPAAMKCCNTAKNDLEKEKITKNSLDQQFF